MNVIRTYVFFYNVSNSGDKIKSYILCKYQIWEKSRGWNFHTGVRINEYKVIDYSGIVIIHKSWQWLTQSISVLFHTLRWFPFCQKLMVTESTFVDHEFLKIAFWLLVKLDTPPWPCWAYYSSFRHLKISWQFCFLPNGASAFKWVSLDFS